VNAIKWEMERALVDEVQAQEPEAVAEWMHDPEAAPHGGESIVSLIGRVAALA